ncbi:SDR family NAD(P)-dependent oxidoreductase [Streptomyces minutiscleroticus]|uniref:SDR family NAD(P)-dependent oxidoreductase n=1 Tax=Streptomyces minutiscleroticus TaxID=68238 RepID=UPI00331B196B
MDDYAGRVLADRYRLPLPLADEYELAETRAFDTYSGQEVLVRQVPLPEVVEAEVLDADGLPDGFVPRRAGGHRSSARTARQPADPAVRRAIEAAQAAARIPDHPRLDQVFDVFAEGGSLWVVSELVSARPLAALLAERPLSPYRAAEVAADVLAALRVLHAHGWVHRNITSRTVLVCDDGRVMLTGLAAGAAEEALCGYDPVPPEEGEDGAEAHAGHGAPGTYGPGDQGQGQGYGPASGEGDGSRGYGASGYGPDGLYGVGLEWVPAGDASGPEHRRWTVVGGTDVPLRWRDAVPVLRAAGSVGEALDAGEPAGEAVVVWWPATEGEPSEAAHEGTRRALDLVQRWLSDERAGNGRLVVLTRGAVAATPRELPDPAQAAVWGLLRSAQSEHPGRFVLVDLDGREASAAALPFVLAHGEAQYTVRDGEVLVPRLLGVRPGAPREDTPRTAEGDEVLVALRAVTSAGAAGVVLAAGPDATGLQPGDRVLTCGSVTADARTVLAGAEDRRAVPDGWSYGRAAAAAAYLRAAGVLAGASKGRPLLVHDAATPAELAVVALARHRGIEVFATAPPAARGPLRALGLDAAHLASSRTAEFGRAFAETLGEHRIGLVVTRGAEPGDAVGGTRAVAVPDTLLGEGALAVDPRTATRGPLPEALTDLPELPHPGPGQDSPLEECRVRTLTADWDPQGTVLITGGTGGLGLRVARHLVADRGMRRLLLLSRRGTDAPGAAQACAELAALGAEVQVHAADVTDPATVTEVLASVPAAHPLTAVVHAAGVIDDGVIGTLTPERLATVLRPKADAAWALHEATRDLDLAGFVLFSSAAGVLGAPGQGNYAAANAFLDALAQHRRATGLPAVSLAWGLWQESSELTAGLTDADVRRMERAGLGLLPTRQGLGLFDVATTTETAASLVAAPLDLRTLRSRAGQPGFPPLLNRLAGKQDSPGTGQAPALPAELAGLSEADRRIRLLATVRRLAAAVLGYGSSGAVAPDQAFTALGLDSLGAVELRARLTEATGLTLPATLVFDFPTPAALADRLLELVEPAEVVSPVHTEIDKLGELLSAQEPDDAERRRITARLEALLWRWTDGHEHTAAQRSPGDDFDDVFEGDSDDDIFALVDRELGMD